MSTAARRRRGARKSDKFAKAVLAPLIPPRGCQERCPDCFTRCMTYPCPDEPCQEHWFACDC